MWTYLIRRLFIMIPTLFGVTIISFCIMKLAPGDPLASQGPEGRSGESREAFLIRKRELKLDLPWVLNFNDFRNFQTGVETTARLRGMTIEQLADELERLAASPKPDQQPLKFLHSLEIPDFERRFHAKLPPDAKDPDEKKRSIRVDLAKAVANYLQIYCEDVGKHGVPVAIDLLKSPDTGLSTKIGAIRCLGDMVVDALHPTFTRDATDAEIPLVLAVWQPWWERQKDKLPPLSADRREVLEGQFQQMLDAESRADLSNLIQEFYFDRNDFRFFADKLLGDTPLADKAIAANILKLYVPRPMELSVPLDASQETVDQVSRNWIAQYDVRQSVYEPSFSAKLWNVISDTQYAYTVWRLITFDFGRSALKTREPVRELLWNAFKVSAPLMLMAQLVIYLISVPLGVVCAVHRGERLDILISLKLFLLYSIPPFVAGMMFLLFLCYGDYLKIFPMQRLHSDGASEMTWGPWLVDYLWHAFLPVTCLSLFSLAALAMYSRTAMLDVLGQDYIRTARAKGLKRSTVIYKHAFRNGLIPILTLFANFLPGMLGGSVIIEVLFGIPGMGMLSWSAIEQKDYPTLMAILYIDAIVVMLSILLTDILYVVVDPRISFGGSGAST